MSLDDVNRIVFHLNNNINTDRPIIDDKGNVLDDKGKVDEMYAANNLMTAQEIDAVMDVVYKGLSHSITNQDQLDDIVITILRFCITTSFPWNGRVEFSYSPNKNTTRYLTIDYRDNSVIRERIYDFNPKNFLLSKDVLSRKWNQDGQIYYYKEGDRIDYLEIEWGDNGYRKSFSRQVPDGYIYLGWRDDGMLRIFDYMPRGKDTTRIDLSDICIEKQYGQYLTHPTYWYEN